MSLTQAAIADLKNGWQFYEDQDPGAGDYFESTLRQEIQTLIELHGVHPERFGCFRMHSSKFPFGIFYHDKVDESEVIAVLDLRRKPSWQRRQLRKR